MNSLTITLVFWGILAGANARTQLTGTYTNSLRLASGDLEVYWNFTDTHITFEVHGHTTGWIGIGLSTKGSMVGADIVVGWVKSGTVKVTDRHGPPGANGFPPLDPNQDIDVLGGTECDGWTMLKFSRQLAACEDDYDREISKATERLIWAFRDGDPVGDDMEPADQHDDKKGSSSVYLLSPKDETQEDRFQGPEYKTFDIRTHNFTIPAVRTHYNCRIVAIPSLTEKHHVIRMDPVIQPGNEEYVHHMTIMGCDEKLLSEVKDITIGTDYDCSAIDQIRSCVMGIVAWAVGGTGSVYPDGVGLSIGSTNDPRLLRIQIHYDNRHRRSDIVDSSGIRFTYTTKIREHDSGFLVLAEVPSQITHLIPPGAESFSTVAECNSRCTQEMLDTAGVQNITIFSSILHSHLAGISMRLRHIRNSVELPFIDEEKLYDFNYQEERRLDPPVVVRPGDDIRLECTYNTENRREPTFGGESTEQEMCFSFLSYYPRIDYARCFSWVLPGTIFKHFGIETFNNSSYTVTAPARLAGMPVKKVLTEYDWTKENIELFEEEYKRMIRRQACFVDSVAPEIYSFNLTNVTAPFTAPRRTCFEPSSPLNGQTSADECAVPTTPLATTPRVTTSPGTTPPATTPRVTTSPGTTPPATTSPATASPATTSPATTSPTTTSPATTSPATTSPATASPATASPATTSPATTSPATTSPATTSPATTSPVTTPPVTTTSDGFLVMGSFHLFLLVAFCAQLFLMLPAGGAVG